MENLENRIMPEKILFRKSFISLVEQERVKYRIPYKDIVVARIRVWDDKAKCYQEPEITEITGDMEGELVLYDRQHIQWVIQTDQSGRKAGSLLEELCIHAPYIMMGSQDWFNCSEEEDYKIIEQMVRTMRMCSKE